MATPWVKKDLVADKIPGVLKKRTYSEHTAYAGLVPVQNGPHTQYLRSGNFAQHFSQRVLTVLML